MTTRSKERPTQTHVKHEILQRYLKAWGGIISGPLIRRQLPIHLVYVDCFACTGKYDGECDEVARGDPRSEVYGSPIIGIRTLDAFAESGSKQATEVSTNAILIEKDKSNYIALRTTLDKMGWSARIRQTANLRSLKAGEIAIINDDALDLVDNLVSYTQSGIKFSFYLLDPYGGSGIPYEFVQKIVSRERHDVMINLLYNDLIRKLGMVRKAEMSASEQQLVGHWASAFGKPRWDSLLTELAALDADKTPLTSPKELKLVDAYRDTLASMDAQLTNKSLPLLFQDKARTMMYLYLTTHDPTGALALNRVLYDGKLLEFLYREQLRIARSLAGGQLPLFADQADLPASQPPSLEDRPSTDEVANQLIQRLAGLQVTRRQVYRAFAEDRYFATEIDRALQSLRKRQMASFAGKLTNHSLISFV